MEFIWTQTVEYVAGTAPYDKYEMQANVFAEFHELEFHKSACSHVYMALNWIGLTNGLTFFKNQYFAHKQL
jgi:hypothetical protein